MCRNQITACAKCRRYITMPRKWFRLTSVSPDDLVDPQLYWYSNTSGSRYLSESIFSLKACSRWCARCGQAVWANFVSQWNLISFSGPCKVNYAALTTYHSYR